MHFPESVVTAADAVKSEARRLLFLRLGLISCGLLVFAPFLNPYHYYPLPTFYTEWLSFALGLVALAAAAMAPSKNAIPIPAMCLGLLALIVLLGVQVALGRLAYPLWGALFAMYLIWAALLVMLGAWLRGALGEASVFHALQWWLALGGTLAAVGGFVQYYRIGLPAGVYVTPVNQMFGTVNQTNHFADYLGCALVSVAFLYARGALRVLPALACAVPVAAGMALSGSRTSWIYMGIAFALPALLRAGGRSHVAGKIFRLVSIAFALFLLVQLLNATTGMLTGPLGKPLSSADRLFDERMVGFGGTGRVQLLSYAWLMFRTAPVLGVGFGEFAWNVFELAADLPGGVPPGIDRYSHNLFAQLLAEGGIAALLCFAVPLGMWLWRTPWRSLSPERCWAVGVLAVVGAHSMLEFPLWHANFLGLFALLFGAASPEGAGLEATRLRRALIGLIAIAGGLTVLSAWSDYRALERWYLVMEDKGAHGENIGRDHSEDLLKLRRDSLFGPYIERVASELIVPDERDLAAKLALNTQVERAYPMPTVVFRQATLLALSGRDADARRTLRAAARVYPSWLRKWLPNLEELARKRPATFFPLLAFAREQLKGAD